MLVSIIVLIAIVSVLLILVVLIQNTKGGGMTAQAPAAQIMGVKRTSDILEQSTWSLVGLLIVLSIGTSFILSNKTDADEEQGINSVNIERASSAPAIPMTTEEGGAAPAAEGNSLEAQPEQKPAKQDSAK